jgi:hypothetical protein
MAAVASSLERSHNREWETRLNDEPALRNDQDFVVALGDGPFSRVEINED